MKQCFRCNQIKPLSEFYSHKGTTDKHLGKCKECARADSRSNYINNIDKRAAYELLRNQRPDRRKNQGIYQERRRAKDPEKYHARVAVGNAVRDGRLKKCPCVVCGNIKSEAHHTDYSKPLDVIWLCKPHHRQADKKVLNF
jgi:hypothetical protein